MPRDLSRLLRPKSIAVIGGGAWCRSILEQLTKAGYSGEIWPVHPRGGEIDGISVYEGINDLPDAPDACFIGINRDATIDAVSALSDLGCGGAVCFASGFAEVEDGQDRNLRLLAAAKEMPILGPNCYGFINALDGALLWPDQHGAERVNSGVAILTQSSNMAINLTMQNRALPISYVVTCGNQAQTSQAEIALGLLDDPRVTAIGLHIEGFGDLRAWENLARVAHEKSVPLVAVKVGKSAEARAATISHTASLAGEDAGAEALLRRLGIARVDDLPSLLETLKIMHVTGPLPNTRIATISCSGGEASLAADTAAGLDITFPPLNPRQQTELFAALGPKVALANPLDYHTYIWRDTEAMTRAFSAMIDPDLDLTALIVDFPRSDRCDPSDWECAIQAALTAKSRTGGRVAMVATLPELMPEDVARRLLDGGVIPLNGLTEMMTAVSAAREKHPVTSPLLLPGRERDSETLTEVEAKSLLQAAGIPVPRSAQISAENLAAACTELRFPLVLKSTGVAHKTETGGVALNLRSVEDVRAAAANMECDAYLLEEMVSGTVAELLVGVVRDPAHGFLLTLGAGGVMTELLQDTTSLLLPASDEQVRNALLGLRIGKLLCGYRGKAGTDLASIVAVIRALQDYVVAHADVLEEVEINPLICTETGAIAADALIRKA